MTILLSITFICGVLRPLLILITGLRIFDTRFEIPLPLKAVFDYNEDTKRLIPQILKYLDELFMWLSLLLQVYHWLFQQAILY